MLAPALEVLGLRSRLSLKGKATPSAVGREEVLGWEPAVVVAAARGGLVLDGGIWPGERCDGDKGARVLLAVDSWGWNLGCGGWAVDGWVASMGLRM